MPPRAGKIITLAVLLSGMAATTGCDALRNLGLWGQGGTTPTIEPPVVEPLPPIDDSAAPPDTTPPTIVPGPLSPGRQNAALSILNNAADPLTFRLLQHDPTSLTQDRCHPLGWTVRGGGLLAPALTTSEYDVFQSVGETDYVVSLRTPSAPTFPATFTLVEFSLRAVNPWADGHTPGTPYNNDHITSPTPMYQADFPSNDDNASARSLIDVSTGAGDVAVLVTGLHFANLPGTGTTRAFMNSLGPTAWLTMIRDDALQSGRFFAIAGALTGGPTAYADDTSTPDGFFNSVQVNGDMFDALSEPVANTNAAAFEACSAGPMSGRPYAFVDLSGVVATPDRGSVVFVMRREAFRPGGTYPTPAVPLPAGSALTKVVIDPSAHPLEPATDHSGNLFSAPTSGYNDATVPGISVQPPGSSSNNAGGPAGVHELAFSVFFIHSI